MLYVNYFDIAALILAASVLVMHALRRGYATLPSKLFVSMAVLAAISSCTDYIGSFTVSYASMVPIGLNYAVNMLYVLSHGWTGAVFYLYALSITRDSLRPKECVPAIVVAVFILVATLVTPFTGWMFSIDAGGYSRGPLMVVNYLISAIMLIGGMERIVRYRHRLHTYQVIVLGISVVAIAAAVVFQMIYPALLLENFFVSLLLVVNYSCLENSALYSYDGTYCYNHRAFLEEVQRRISRGLYFTVVAFGFDDMAYLHHVAGPSAMAASVRSCIGLLHSQFSHPSVFYLGSSRFAILTKREQVPTTISRVKDCFAEPVQAGSLQLDLRPCFAVLHHPGLVESAEEALAAIRAGLADREEFGGPEAFRVDGTSLDRVRRDAEVLHVLSQALETDTLQVRYQPIAARDGGYPGAEALVRLEDSSGNIVSPDVFIPIAERNGMVVELGEQVLRKVCAFWRENDLAARGVSFIDVNMSPVQCMRDDCSSRVQGIMREYGISPFNINFEITETAEVATKMQVKANMESLTRVGFSFSMDDYGSGFASVTNLTRLPFKMVKIDKSLLWAATNDDRSMTVLANTVKGIRDLGIECLVEGVESRRQEEMVWTLNCEYQQGYLHSRPLFGDEYLSFLEKNN